MLLDRRPSAQPPLVAALQRIAAWAWLRPGRVLVGALVLLAVAVIELVCARLGMSGPTVALLRSYVFEQPAATGFYCALILALVLVRAPLRWWVLGAAVATDLLLAAVRLLVQGQVRSFGNGALIVLTVFAGYVVVRMRGAERVDALRGLACAAALVAATTVGNVWLEITARVRPGVLDEYVELADRALGSPSWFMGRVFAGLGAPGHYGFLAVYSMLPLAAVVVAAVQLRGGWLRHNVMLTFIAIGLLGPLIYLVFPVVGPAYAFGTSGGAFALSAQWPQQTPVTALVGMLPFDAFTPRNCMPSLHTAWAVVLFLHTRSMGPWIRRLGTLWLLGTLAATLGFGYHYGVDLVAGTVFALTVEAALRSRVDGWSWPRAGLVGYGGALLAGLLLGVRFGTPWIHVNPAWTAAFVLAALTLMVYGYWRLAPAPAVAEGAGPAPEMAARTPAAARAT